MGELMVKRLRGAEAEGLVEDLARLRIAVFRDFPYLYDGDAEYEADYLRHYTQSDRSVIVAVWDGARMVGASTGMPLLEADEAFRRPFLEHGYDPARVFYLGESVLERPYRGRGLGHRFFDEREAHARELGGFDLATFCAVERPADHPRRPPGYRPLDAFWRRRGYQKQPHLITHFSWRDLDEDEETAKPMVFWTRSLA